MTSSEDQTPGAFTRLIDARVAQQPRALALLEPGRSPLDYSGLGECTAELGRQLQRNGIGAGRRVALVMPNSSATAERASDRAR